jgi:hypothetical protein
MYRLLALIRADTVLPSKRLESIMKYTRMITILLILTSSILSGTVFAHGGGGGHGGGGHGGGGGHWGGGGFRGGFGGYGGGYALGAMAGFGGLYYGMGYPYNYGYNYPYSYPYYSQSVVPIQQAAPVYIQQTPQAATIPPPAATQQGQNAVTNNQNETGNWYFCRESNAYYPYVSTCPNGWEQVAPTPPQQ